MEELPGWDERLLSFKNDLMLVFDVEHGSERYQQVGFTRMPHLELVGQMVLIAAAVARYTRSSRRWWWTSSPRSKGRLSATRR